MSWIKKIVFSLSIFLVSSLFGVLLVEGLLQILKNEDGWGKTREANILRNIEFQYNIENIYNSDNSLVSYVRNNHGLRDSCTTVKEIEILTIGGSTTDLRFVAFEDTYQKVMENRLIAMNPNFGCVTNAGIDAQSTRGHIFSFEHWFPLIPNLKPSYVLFYVGINDANFNKNFPVQVKGASSEFIFLESRGLKGWFKQFEIVNRLLPLYRYLRQSRENSEVIFAKHGRARYTEENYIVTSLNKNTERLSRKNADAFKERFELLLSYVERMGATPICVTQPHRYVMRKNGARYGIASVFGKKLEFSGLDYDYSIQELNTVMASLCGDNLLDLYNFNFEDEHFYDGVHTTALGSIEIGNAMADYMITRYKQKPIDKAKL
jgi:hypothetical protein